MNRLKELGAVLLSDNRFVQIFFFLNKLFVRFMELVHLLRYQTNDCLFVLKIHGI